MVRPATLTLGCGKTCLLTVYAENRFPEVGGRGTSYCVSNTQGMMRRMRFRQSIYLRLQLFITPMMLARYYETLYDLNG